GLPRTRIEDQSFGEARDELASKAKRAVEQVRHEVAEQPCPRAAERIRIGPKRGNQAAAKKSTTFWKYSSSAPVGRHAPGEGPTNQPPPRCERTNSHAHHHRRHRRLRLRCRAS